MHIVIFVDFDESAIGGVSTSIRGQRKGLEDLGHRVTVVSPQPLGEVTDDPTVIRVPTVPFVRPNGFPLAMPSHYMIRRIEKALDTLEPIDIIHVQTNIGIGMMGVAIAKRRGIPLVQTMHGRDDVFAETYALPYLTTMGARLGHRRLVPHASKVPRLNDTATVHNAWQVMVQQAQAADYIIMPSHHFADKFRAHGVTKPMEVISNGISDQIVAKLPRTIRSLPKAGTLHVMWCGRLSMEKRPIDAIEAAMAVPGCTIDLYGDGPLEKSIHEHIKSHGYGKRVRLKGLVKQAAILKAMRTNDVLLYPSFGFDNQPMVLLEAVAAGIPVVYCDPDLTECMPKSGAVLTKDQQVDSITAALADLLAHPKTWLRLHTSMIAHRDQIVQSYHTKKMLRIYARLAKKRRAGVV